MVGGRGIHILFSISMPFIKIALFGGLLLSLAGLSACSFFSRSLQTLWIEAESPTKKWVLVVSYTAPFSFRGAHTIQVDARNLETKQRETLFETTLENEGSGLAKRNYTLSWEDETAIFTLRGHDQPDETYRINPNNDVPYELVPLGEGE